MLLTLNRLNFSRSYWRPKFLLLPYTCNGIKDAVLTASTKMGVTEFVFELQALKAKVKGVFRRPYCCYGNLLHHKINSNLFPNDWAVC